MRKGPTFLALGLEDQVKPNVEALLEFDVWKKALASMIAQYLYIMGIELKACLASKLV